MDCDKEELEVTKNINNDCKCCSTINKMQELIKKLNANDSDYCDLKVTLESYKEKENTGTIRYFGFNLKYCPECGRKVSG